MSQSLCKHLVVLLALLLGHQYTQPAFAATLFVETFDTNTSDVTDGSYPLFTLNAGTASVTNEELQLDGGFSLFVQRFTTPGFSGDLTICGKVRAATFGFWTAGMEFGNRRFIFHPGFPGGAFRIEDATLGFSGGILVGNTDMGFTPSDTALHPMQIEWDSGANLVTITIADGDGVGGPFVFAWTPDANFISTDPIGFTSQANASSTRINGPAFFDDLWVGSGAAGTFICGDDSNGDGIPDGECTAPVPFATLTLIGAGDGEGTRDDDDEGLFDVDFGILNDDACQPTTCTGELVCGSQSTSVELGQIVEIERDDEGCEVEIEEGFLEIEGDVFLEVTCTNSAGSGMATATPPGLAPDNDVNGVDFDD